MSLLQKDLFLIKNWPEGAVVFDRRFGDTHALNLVTSRVFELLRADPQLNFESIPPHLQAEFSELASDELRSQISHGFDQLLACGLIERA